MTNWRFRRRLAGVVLFAAFGYILWVLTMVIPQDRATPPLQYAPFAEVEISAEIVPPEMETNSEPTLRIRDSSYFLNLAEGERAPTRWCVDMVYVTSYDAFSERLAMPVIWEPLYCEDLFSGTAQTGYMRFEDASIMLWGNSISRGTDRFWYPYDGFQLSFLVEIYYRRVYSDGTASVPQKSTAANIVAASSEDWMIQEVAPSAIDASEAVGLTQAEAGAWHTYRFRRPLMDRIMFPFIIVTVLSFIVLLCFANSRSTFIEGAVGVFFGIFGVTQVLLPAALRGRTIVHYATWGLYVALAVVLLAQLRSAFKERGAHQFGKAKLRPKQRPPEDTRLPPPREQPGEPTDIPAHARPALVELLARAYLLIWMLRKPFKRKKLT